MARSAKPRARSSGGGSAPSAPADAAFEAIKSWIEHGQLSPGSRLPSERILAGRLAASRFAVRDALDRLQREGLIVSVSPRIRAVAGRGASANRSSTTVAVLSQIVPPEADTGSRSNISWMYHLGILRAIQAQGRSALTIPPLETTGEMLRRVENERPCGILVMCDALTSQYRDAVFGFLKTVPLPVCVNADSLRAEEVASLQWDRVEADHQRGSYDLTSWLISQGRKRILRFWPEDLADGPAWMRGRDAGYEKACSDAGLQPLDPIYVPGTPHGPDRDAFLRQVQIDCGFLMDAVSGRKPVDAILVATDGIYWHVAAACRKLGRIPGADVVIAGYDNYWGDMGPERGWEPTAPAATVDNCYDRIGSTMLEMILARLENKTPKGPQVRRVAPLLKVTESG